MKILFVIPDVRPELIIHNGSVFEGIAYLSSYLKNDGHETIKWQPTEAVSHEPLLALIIKEKPDIIAYSAVTNMIKYVERWAPQIKKSFPQIHTILGGVHATAAPDHSIAIEGIDAICVGEGEFALTEYCRRIKAGQPFQDIPSLWVKTENGVFKNPVGSLPETLNDYPFPDLDLFEVEKSYYYMNRFAVMKLSRGCPLPCTYCCNRLFMDMYDGNYIRYPSPENAIKYIETYLQKYPNIDAIAFLDDILPMKKEWFEEFTHLYKLRIGLPYTARCLVNVTKPDTIRALADSGCYEVTFGVEAGSENYRRTILRRHQTGARIIEAFRLCTEHNIQTRANMMVGLPYETSENIVEGIELCSKLNSKFFLVSTFFPTPATQLYDVCLKEGYIDENMEIPDSPYTMKSAITQPSITTNQVEFYRAHFAFLVRLFEFTPNNFHGILRKVLAHKILPHSFFTKLTYLLIYPLFPN